MSERAQFNILDGNATSINQDFIITLPNTNIRSADREIEKRCKIIQFSSEWNFHDISLYISRLDSQRFPNLFIFIINYKNFGFSGQNSNQKSEEEKILRKILSQFYKKRSLILQLTSCDENVTKICFKEENFEEWRDVEEISRSEGLHNLSSFFWIYLNDRIEDFENSMLNSLPKVEDSSIILKFLNTLDLSQEFLDNLVLKCTAEGSLSDFLAAANVFKNEKGQAECLNPKYFTNVLSNSKSILHNAVQNSNNDIIKFLVKNFTNLIQQLPFEHQVDISTAAFSNGQVEVLCDLVEFSDFPFPKYFESDAVTDVRLRKIVEERKKIHHDILEENLDEIEEFIDKNSELKFAYNPENKSAFSNALSVKKYKAFFFLKSLGFEDKGIQNYEDGIEDDEKQKLDGFAWKQIRKNINFASCTKKSIVSLLARTLIFRRYRNSETEEEQCQKITKWFEEIYRTKFGLKIFDAAAQCYEIKIIFDFEYKTVHNVDLYSNSSTFGRTYPLDKHIFIGAKLGEEGRTEQEVKGTIVHEICHYVTRLVYQNKMNPYYNDDDENREKFAKITAEIKDMLFPKLRQEATQIEEQYENDENDDDVDDDDEEEEEEEDEELLEINDGCDEIISQVFTCYKKEAYQLELIVRPAHIQAQFDDDEEKVKNLEEFYKKLFEFFEFIVIPEMEKFSLEKREKVQNLNNVIGLLSDLKKSKIEFSNMKSLSDLTNRKNQLVISTSNVPKLLQLEICRQLDEKYEMLLDKQNIFITPQILENSYISKSFKQILKQKTALKIFVDCSKGIGNIFNVITSFEDLKLIFIVSNESQCEELSKKLKEIGLNPIKIAVNYNWTDLTAECQNKLLQIKVNFQNNRDFSLTDLIENETDPQHQGSASNIDSMIDVDAQLLNLLLEKNEIQINSLVDEKINDKYFKCLFQSRKLIKNHKTAARGTKKIPQEEMLENVKDQKFVLISDIAGSGKSWIMKNFTNKHRELHPKKWTTYVDLKQFIDEFKSQNIQREFSVFMAEKILKLKTKFEAEIFKKLYKNGKVCILCDGFDEIAPDYAEIVSKLFQSFQQNGGNQLWIATRDYFEVNLLRELSISIVYKFEDLTEEEGMYSIAASWTLNDLKDENLISMDDFMSFIKSHPNFGEYKEIAQRLVEKAAIAKKRAIGMPQIYRMIAEGFKNDKSSALQFTEFLIFKKFAEHQYKIWSDEGGEIRKADSIASQSNELSFWTLHELSAMKQLFPEELDFCGIQLDKTEWSDDKIIGCGLMTKKSENFFFPHRTFCEFFAASFLARILKRRKVEDKTYEFLTKILIKQEFGVVRMFLNDAIDGNVNIQEIAEKTEKFVGIFYQMEAFDEIFIYNLRNLVDLTILILKKGDYSIVKQILERNASNIAVYTGEAETYMKFINFLLDYLKDEDLKAFILEQKFFHGMIKSSMNIEIFEDFVKTIEEKFDSNFVRDALEKVGSNFWDGNIFYYLSRSTKIDAHKIQKCLNILKIYFSTDEIFQLMKKCNNDGDSILHVCVQKEKNMEEFTTIWTEVQSFLTSQGAPERFKELIIQQTVGKIHSGKENFLQFFSNCDDIDFHELVWALLLRVLTKSDELKNFLLQKDSNSRDYVHNLARSNKSLDVIEFTFRIIKENLNEDEFHQILTSQDSNGNILLSILQVSNNIKLFNLLWKTYRDSFINDHDFMAVLQDVPKEHCNILHMAVSYSTSEIFNFIVDQIEKIASMKKMLKAVNESSKLNLLQTAAWFRKPLEFHQSLWKILKKYLTPSEIIKLVRHADESGKNILVNVFDVSPFPVVEMTFSEVLAILRNIPKKHRLEQQISQLEVVLNEILCTGQIKEKEMEMLKMEWTIKMSFSNCKHLFNNFEAFKEFKDERISQGRFLKSPDDLRSLAMYQNLNIHEESWDYLTKTYNNLNELRELITSKCADGNDFIHSILIYGSSDILSFTFDTLTKTFNEQQIKEILKSRGHKGRTLLQAAAYGLQIDNYRHLWKIIRDIFDPPEIQDLISNEDFCLIFDAVESNSEILDHTWKEIEVLMNNDAEFTNKIIKVIKENKINVLHLSAKTSDEKILKVAWTEVRKFLSPLDFKELLLRNVPDSYFKKLKTLLEVTGNVLHLAAECKKVEYHKILWELLFDIFEDKEELKKFVLKTVNYKMNFVHNLIKVNELEIIEYTLNLFKANFNDKQFQEILLSSGKRRKTSLLHTAVENSKDINVHKFLFITLKNSISSEKKVLKLLEDVDQDGYNIFAYIKYKGLTEVEQYLLTELENLERLQ